MSLYSRTTTVLIAGLLAATLVAAPVAGAAQSAHQQDDEPSLVVELDEDGDATVELTMTYDLASEEEREAFRSLQDDEEAQADAADRFAARLGAVADNASERTDREMRVPADSAAASVEERGDVGVVTLSVAWENLAAVEDGRLVVTEPFASGYETDRPFAVVAPDGHAVASATPAPDEETDGAATWDAGTELDGFEVVAEGDGAASETEDVGSLPGFGVAVALGSILVAAAIAARRTS